MNHKILIGTNQDWFIGYRDPYFMAYEIHSGKLTWQWKMGPLKMYFLLKMGIFHCYVSLPEGNPSGTG